MQVEQVKRLIQWLQNSSVTQFDFTIEGRQEVCKPKYLLIRDRDLIIRLLERECTDNSALADELDCYDVPSGDLRLADLLMRAGAALRRKTNETAF
jgi:hypothetical protein